MARPERRDADYFPFICKDGRTLFILEAKYQCKGTGFFTNVMRFLTMQTDHHVCIKEETDRLFFFSRTKCDEESGMDMLEIMAKTGKIHPKLWAEYHLIVSPDLLNSLKDAYKNRKNPMVTIDEILISYPLNSITSPNNPQEPVVSSPDNPQRKLKDTKLKKTKEKILHLDAVSLTEEEYKKLTEKYGEEKTQKAIEILNNAIMSKGYKYKSHYHTLIGWPMKEVQGNGTGRDSSGRSGLQTTPKEWIPDTPISDEQRAKNLQRVKQITGG